MSTKSKFFDTKKSGHPKKSHKIAKMVLFTVLGLSMTGAAGFGAYKLIQMSRDAETRSLSQNSNSQRPQTTQYHYQAPNPSARSNNVHFNSLNTDQGKARKSVDKATSKHNKKMVKNGKHKKGHKLSKHSGSKKKNIHLTKHSKHKKKDMSKNSKSKKHKKSSKKDHRAH